MFFSSDAHFSQSLMSAVPASTPIQTYYRVKWRLLFQSFWTPLVQEASTLVRNIHWSPQPHIMNKCMESLQFWSFWPSLSCPSSPSMLHQVFLSPLPITFFIHLCDVALSLVMTLNNILCIFDPPPYHLFHPPLWCCIKG